MNPHAPQRRWRQIAVLCASAMLASCDQGPLDPHGPIGHAERVILLDATVIMLAVVIPVILLTLLFAWWFRAGNRRAVYRPEWEYSGRIELIVWAIPALVILFLGGIAWIGSHELDPPKALTSRMPAEEIEVVALDWRWLFIYPSEHIATVNYLVVPTGVPLHFRLTSTSVMNSFFIPQLGSQIYAMTGMTTQLNLQADQPGTYQGLSAQFSGPGFSDMRFTLRAESAERYAAWLAQARQSAATLDGASFVQLVRPTRGAGEQTFGSVAIDAFGMVANDHMPTHWTTKQAL